MRWLLLALLLLPVLFWRHGGEDDKTQRPSSRFIC